MIVDQLTTDPQKNSVGQLASDGPVILAWGRNAVLDVSVEGQGANQVSNVLYYVPVPMDVRGKITFQADLLTSTIVQTDAGFFNQDPSTLNFGRGSATVSYRPCRSRAPWMSATSAGVRFRRRGRGGLTGGIPIRPIDDRCLDPKNKQVLIGCPKPIPADQFDGMPESRSSMRPTTASCRTG
jgi:hypothetical protein